MFNPLFLQIASDAESLKITGEVGICVLLIGKIVDIWNNYREGQDRKKHTEEFTRQTEILRNVDSHLTSMKDNQLKDTQAIAIGTERQKNIIDSLGRVESKVDFINRGVRDLKLIAGIPDTETTHIKKNDVKPN